MQSRTKDFQAALLTLNFPALAASAVTSTEIAELSIMPTVVSAAVSAPTRRIIRMVPLVTSTLTGLRTFGAVDCIKIISMNL